MSLAGARLPPSLIQDDPIVGGALPKQPQFAKVLHATNSVHTDLHDGLGVVGAGLCGARRRP
jgi:hypothetical protein